MNVDNWQLTNKMKSLRIKCEFLKMKKRFAALFCFPLAMFAKLWRVLLSYCLLGDCMIFCTNLYFSCICTIFLNSVLDIWMVMSFVKYGDRFCIVRLIRKVVLRRPLVARRGRMSPAERYNWSDHWQTMSTRPRDLAALRYVFKSTLWCHSLVFTSVCS